MRDIPGVPGQEEVQIVPKCHQSDNNSVRAFEELKNANSGIRFIIEPHALKLTQMYNSNLPEDEENKMLGNTGISMTRHPSKPKIYILKK
jgi:hypothetical protein